MNEPDRFLKHTFIIAIFLSVVMILIYVFTGLPSEVKENIENINLKIIALEKTFQGKEKEFNSKRGLNAVVDEYIKRENILNFFNLAREQHKNLQANKAKLENILSKNSKDDILSSQSLISSSNILLNSFRHNINQPMIVYLNLVRIQEKQAQIIKDANSKLSLSMKKFDDFLLRSNDFISQFVEKEKDISLKKENVSKLMNELSLLNKGLNSEGDLFKFAILEKDFMLKEKELMDLIKFNEDLYAQLNTSYSKILSDMNVKYYIFITRTSWDEGSDFGEREYDYGKIEISEEEYAYLEKITESLATYSNSFLGSGFKANINPAIWNRFRITENKSNLPGSHNSAEWWIKDLTIEYFHQYTIIENDKTSIKWNEVSEDVFYDNIKNLNMELLSKPYGKYESEKSTSPVPAGMSFVGNNKYGEWKSDASGNSFWHYYGMYSFMNNMFFDNHRYSKNNYNSYSYGQAYYGDGEYGSAGKYKPKNNSRAADKIFKSKEYSEFKNNYGKNSSVKSAGSSARGRGPSGGGK